jgi:hypothetical protein
MLETLVPIVTLVRLVQATNAQSPILVTLSGIETLVRLEYPNASYPMLMTSRPSIMPGMLTSPPES